VYFSPVKLCYIDESGGSEAPDSDPSATPVFAIGALIVDADEVPKLTRDFVSLKCRHFATKMLGGQSLDQILTEVKGTQILSLHRSSSRNKRRQASRFVEEVLQILNAHGVQVMGRIWVKAAGQTINVRTRYGYAVQDFAKALQNMLQSTGEDAMMIADSREGKLNSQVAHSLFTQKWRSGGDPYPRVREVPLFASSDNHAGLQLADHLVTGLLFPMATAAYGTAFPEAVHLPSRYEHIRDTFGADLQALLYSYRKPDGRPGAGVQTTDLLARRPSSLLFTA
jgi:hypothetical protein